MHKKIIFLFSVFSWLFAQAEEMKRDTLSLIFVGDAMMHQTQINGTQVGDTFDFKDYFQQVQDEISSAGIAVVNMEVPLGGKPYSGYPVFSSPDEFAVALKEAGFDLFLLANNHTLDKRTPGLLRTFDVLDSLQIKYTGAFANAEIRERRYPLIMIKNGFRIAMLNYTYSTNGFVVEPPASINYIDKKQIAKDIAEAKLMRPNLIVANMHWGVEYQQVPSTSQVELAEWLLQQGVHLVIGNHPHVVQPIELRKDEKGKNTGLIAYSLGNLVSNMQIRNTTGGGLLKVVISKDAFTTSIDSASYALLFTERYKNERGKDAVRVLPAAKWSENESFHDKNRLDIFLNDTRSLYRKYNKNIEEYKF